MRARAEGRASTPLVARARVRARAEGRASTPLVEDMEAWQSPHRLSYREGLVRS